MRGLLPFRRPRRRVLGAAGILAIVTGLGAWWTGLPSSLLPGGPPLPRVIYGPGTGTVGGTVGGTFMVRAAVIDGDTLSAAGTDRLRLHGIDAPEADQICRRDGRTYACGVRAREAMVAIIGSGALSCEGLGADRYGRRIVRCRNAQGADIAAALVRQGWALAFRRFSDDYAGQEAAARAARQGLWAGSFDAPWDWRARQRP